MIGEVHVSDWHSFAIKAPTFTCLGPTFYPEERRGEERVSTMERSFGEKELAGDRKARSSSAKVPWHGTIAYQHKSFFFPTKLHLVFLS